MGITQHRNAVATIKEISNVAFLQGNIGQPGAGLFPVRGHSNVQGDRTMGIWERPPAHFLDALEKEFGFDPPREHGLDTVDAIRALRDGDAHVFVGLGGNFIAAAPDTDGHRGGDAQRRPDRADLHQAQPLPRRTGEDGADPADPGRTEKDRTGGRTQRITVEDSVCAVHASQGPLEPASPHLRSEVDIVCSIAKATLGDRHGLTWDAFRNDYTEIRKRIARVVPGCEAYDEKVDRPGGFALPHPPRDTRTFDDESGKAVFTVSPIDVLHVPGGAAADADAALPRPVQHHDLRPRRPLPRDLGRPPGGVRAPATTSPRSGCDLDQWSTWSASGATARSAPPRPSGSSPTTSRVAARRRTTRRRTRWSRSTRPRCTATARRPRR